MSLQEDIIAQLGVKPVIDPQEEIRRSIDFLKDYLQKHPFLKTFVLGISGGQDSTLAGRLAQLAMEEMRSETGDASYQFVAVRLPYGVQADEADAQKALAFIQPDVSLVVNIKESVDAMERAVEATGTDVSDFNKGNIKARSRMIAQYALAGAYSGAVIGTDHAAENITGFFTKFGDGGADILPLYRLNKRQGKQLLQALGADPALYEKVPIADLEEEKPGIADEVALGVTYAEIVYEVCRNECFYAWKGSKAYLDGKEIRVTDVAVLDKAFVALGFPYDSDHYRPVAQKLVDRLYGYAGGTRLLGSAAAELCYVACGRFDARIEGHLGPWDVAAGGLILMQAGGRLSDFAGGDTWPSAEQVMASNGVIHDKILRLL